MRQCHYSRSPSTSYLLDYARGAILEDANALRDWAKKAGKLVHIGALEFFEAWDALWLAAVAAGVDQIVAQQRIGEAFADARGELVAA